ncbi:hypothetical protein HDU86_000466 [Geranomyces michiganensis]|nr:hypothetical protein HDU86_000466 [Geranomyces michiganensis]
MNSPFASAMLALIVGFHPSVRPTVRVIPVSGVCYMPTRDLPLQDFLQIQAFFFTSVGSSIGTSLNTLGDTSIPFQRLQLGGRLEKGPTRDHTTTLPARAIAYVVFTRLIIGPCIGLAFVILLKAAHIGIEDPMLVFVLLLEAGTPPALNLAVIAELYGHGEKDMANLLFWNYLFAVPGALVTVVLYLAVLPSLIA